MTSTPNDQDPTGVGREVAGDQVEQRRLAGAVGADDADRLAAATVKSRSSITGVPNDLLTSTTSIAEAGTDMVGHRSWAADDAGTGNRCGRLRVDDRLQRAVDRDLGQLLVGHDLELDVPRLARPPTGHRRAASW